MGDSGHARALRALQDLTQKSAGRHFAANRKGKGMLECEISPRSVLETGPTHGPLDMHESRPEPEISPFHL